MALKAALLEEFTTKLKMLNKDEIIKLGRELDKIDAPNVMFEIMLDVCNERYGFDATTDMADAWLA